MRHLWALVAAAATMTMACDTVVKAQGSQVRGVQRKAPGSPSAAKTVTSEEVRLSSIGQGRLRLISGQRYRIVGRVRSLQATATGQPKVVFTGLNAVLDRSVPRAIVERLTPGRYIGINCVFVKSDDIFPLMNGCTGLTSVPTTSASNYYDAYEQNPFQADSQYKDRDVIIYGEVRLKSRLTDGRDYVSLHAQRDFSDVTAIISPDAKAMSAEYAKQEETAVMLCRGGYRYNMVGSVGLKDCRFLQNY